MRETDRLEDRLQQVRDRRFGDRAQGEGTDGDAELGRRHHLGQAFQTVEDLTGPCGAQWLDLAAADGDESELGADEESVGEHEQCGEEELEGAHRAASTTWPVRTRRTRSAR